VAQWVRYLNYPATHTNLLPIRRGFAPCFVDYNKTRLAAASDKVYRLLAHGRWFSPGTPASSTTKTGRHDIAEILLKVALNTINKYNQTDFVFVGSTRSYCFQNQDKNNLASRFSSLVLMCLSALNIKTYDGNYIDLFTLKNINCCVCFFNLLFIYLFIFCFVFFVFFCFVCVCVLRRDILTSL
jgi:hypothetical protein